ESAGAGNAVLAFTGRIGIAPGDRTLAAVIDGKDRNAVLAEDQRSFAHAQRLRIDRARLAHRRSKVGSARHDSRCLRGVGDGAAEFGGHGRGLPVPCAGPWKALHAVVPETASALFGAWWSGGTRTPGRGLTVRGRRYVRCTCNPPREIQAAAPSGAASP